MTHSSPSSDRQGFSFRFAHEGDLAAIVALLADDGIGKGRENAAPQVLDVYRRAFADIQRDERNSLIVGERDGVVLACCQVTFIPGLSRRGAERALVESVRVQSSLRGQGVGSDLMAHVIALARKRGAALVQLTSDTRRGDAHRFYERLGFVPSHVGFKLELASASGEP